MRRAVPSAVQTPGYQLGLNIKAKRTQVNGMTQQELAQKTREVSRQVLLTRDRLSNIERNATEITAIELRAIAIALNTSIDYFFDGVEI